MALLAASMFAVGATSAADTAQAPTPTNAAKPQPKFDIYEFRVLGNTVLPTRDIEATVYPFLGAGKTLADVESARAALEGLYHGHGYATVFVDIPPQDVVDKIVRLRVTEGRVERTRISGARYFSEGKILDALPQAQPGAVPNIPALQQELAALNSQTSDRTVIPVLKAGTEPGTMDLDLKVSDQSPLHGSVELNNQSSADTEPLRVAVALNYSNFLAELDNIAVQFQDSPQAPNQVQLIAANYMWHPLWDGIQPSIFYINSSSNVAAVGTLGVIGKGEIFGSRLSFPVDVTPAFSDSLTLGLDYKHFRDTVNVDATTALETPVYYVNTSVAYLANWRGQAGQETLSLAANFGPRGLANDNPLEFADKRFEGRGNYFYLRADGSWIRNLPWGFQSVLRIAGQYTAEPLISNEDYSIGGIDAVRGYLEAEELGDSAIKGTIQLRSPLLGHWRTARIGDLFVFYDAGTAFTLDPLAGQPQHIMLRSWGSGMDLFPGGSIVGSLLLAHPLTDGPETPAGTWRVLFSVRGTF
jgi:hemolysin activation/secretion protein